MITNLYLDLETVPNEGCFMFNDAVKAVKPPANYSKPESIQKWLDENLEFEQAKARHALGLQPPYARIVSLSFAVDDGPVTTFHGNDERATLECFFEDLAREMSTRHNGYAIRPIGHNVIGFDLPVLWWACLRNSVPYYLLPHPRDLKPWERTKAFDTMQVLSMGNTKGYSLGNMCKLFNIPDPFPDVDGSQVWAMWMNGECDKVADYNAADVKMVRELYKRIREWAQ